MVAPGPKQRLTSPYSASFTLRGNHGRILSVARLVQFDADEAKSFTNPLTQTSEPDIRVRSIRLICYLNRLSAES